MNKQAVLIPLRWLCTAALSVVLMMSMLPIRDVQADGITTTSDLVVELISIPKHAKACQVFEVTFKVTNLGPDPASRLWIWTGFTDQFDPVGVLQAPDSLAVGETVTLKALVKVTAFVPGESRNGWVSANISSDPAPDTSIDPNPDNNSAGRNVRLISKPAMTCSP